MSKKIIVGILVVLLAGEIGFVMWKKHAAEQGTGPSQTNYTLSYPRLLPNNPNLTAAEKKVFLDRPTSASSSVEISQSIGNIVEAAVPTDHVSIGASCRPTPVVARIPNAGSITFTNSSSAALTLIIKKIPYDLAKGQSVKVGPFSVPGNPERDTMSVSYRCADSKSPVGFVYVSSVR